MTFIVYITIHPSALVDVEGEYIIYSYLILPTMKYGQKIVDLSRFDPINFYLLPLLKMGYLCRLPQILYHSRCEKGRRFIVVVYNVLVFINSVSN